MHLRSLKTKEKCSFLAGQSAEGLSKAHCQSHASWKMAKMVKMVRAGPKPRCHRQKQITSGKEKRSLELRGWSPGFRDTELFPEYPCPLTFPSPAAGRTLGEASPRDGGSRASHRGSIPGLQSQAPSSIGPFLSPHCPNPHHCKAESHPSFKVQVKYPFLLLPVPAHPPRR